MSSIAEQINTEQDKDGMLRRALERIIQLYTDKSHFIYELLQNAEDAGATSVKFLKFYDRLEVLHNGKPFTKGNLQGLCDIGKSDKLDNLNQIGEFGVGFKSVFSICDRVKLYSDPSRYSGEIGDAVPFAIEIYDFTRPVDITDAPIPCPYTTKFIFPFTVGQTFSGYKSVDELSQALSTKLQNLGITTLLFMKSLKLIEYEEINGDEIVVSGKYELAKTAINDHCSLVSACGISNADAEKGGMAEKISYLKFTRQIAAVGNRSVDIAFPVVVNEDGTYTCRRSQNPYISVYFPTETESKLGFIVQGPYRTTPNRSSVPPDDDDNIGLVEETAALLKDSIIELRRSNKFNMSFIKVLPLSEDIFENYPLFRPLYTMVKELLMYEEIIPNKAGGYSFAEYSKISRQERLVTLFSDEMLSDLIDDGRSYSWLPTYLTETNKEYEAVYHYLTAELKIRLIRPEDLRPYFADNPYFLLLQSDDWLVELYKMFENVRAAFYKDPSEANMLTANIIKTSTGKFVSAYRLTNEKQYLPNVFLPSDKVRSSDINFVDSAIYERCKRFFNDILQLQPPNAYDFFVKDFGKRYPDVFKPSSQYVFEENPSQYIFEEDSHIFDIKQILHYLKSDEHKEEILGLVKKNLVLRCTDGQMRNAYRERVFLPTGEDDIDIEAYIKNIADDAFIVDAEFYRNKGVDPESLCSLGIKNSLLQDESIKEGDYDTDYGGRKRKWSTQGDFCWKLTIYYLERAIEYISDFPSEKDSIIKSKTIFTIILKNESKLCGTVNITGKTPDLSNEPCKLLKILRRQTISRWDGRWDGRWLYTESNDLVSPQDVSKYDISQSIYGRPKINSRIYDWLKFRRVDADEIKELKQIASPRQLNVYFEDEIHRRYGLSSADLDARLLNSAENKSLEFKHGHEDSFPVDNVKNWESLKKHVAEMLIYAYPVKYEYVVRSIRVSTRAKDARAYLLNMYKQDGEYKYACQMCHEFYQNIESVQIFNNPELELDPLNLCLCPNCAAKYRQIRFSESTMEAFENDILHMCDNDVTRSDVVQFYVDRLNIWFTQKHIAEIRFLLQFLNNSQVESSVPLVSDTVKDDDSDETNGLAVFSQYVGRRLRRQDGFLGEVKKFEKGWLIVDVLEGEKAGSEIKLSLKYIIEHPDVYQCE